MNASSNNRSNTFKMNVFLPLSFFHKCFPVAHLWPFQSPSLCTFLFLQPTHYEQQDLGELSETIQR